MKPTRIPNESEFLSPDFPDYEIVEHVQLNCTDVDGNNNKFYSAEFQRSSTGKFRIYTHYGRVKNNAHVGAFEVRGPGSEAEIRKEFDSIIKEKTTRKKETYTKIDFVKSKVGSPKARQIVRTVEADPSVIKVVKSTKKITLDPTIIKLVEGIYADAGNALKSMINVQITANGFETPLGVLAPKQIDNGRQILLSLKDAMGKNDAIKIKKYNNDFFSVIPHQFGYKITENDWIKSDDKLQNASDLLQLMADSLQLGSAAYVGDAEEKYNQLGVDIAPLLSSDKEYQEIQHYILSTISDHHSDLKGIKVRNIFRIHLPHDRKKYESCNVPNEKTLFHGSRNSNIVGILKRGLLIAPPEAPVSGYAFAKGNYFADASSKSINYSLKSFGRHPAGNNCFLFLSKVRLGKMLELEDGRYDADIECFKRGCNSTLGKKGYRLLHNEYITYKLEQNSLTFLVELSRPY